MCVECLEKIAENLEKFEQGGRTILPHEVWTALRSRCFVAGAVRVSGFRALRQGGGRWTLACPLCVKVDLMPPTPRVPKTLTGEPYFDMPPKLHKQWKGILRAPLVIENSVAGPVRSHSVEVLVYEQLVGNDEAQCFRRMPAIGQYAVFWQPPIPSPGTDDDGLNVRIIAGIPADGSQWVLLSAVAFGALKGCQPRLGKAANDSPTLDSTAQLARLIMESCTERVVGHGPRKENNVGHRSHVGTFLPLEVHDYLQPLASATATTADSAITDVADVAIVAPTGAGAITTAPIAVAVAAVAATTPVTTATAVAAAASTAAAAPVAYDASAVDGDLVVLKRCRTARSKSAVSLWQSAFRCVRAGGAFGVLYGVGTTSDDAKARLCHPRCDAGLPRSLEATVAVPIVRDDHVSGLLPIWISPISGKGASLGASSHPPVSGADVMGAALYDMMKRDEPGARDGVNLLARMTSVKLTVAGILLTAGEQLGMSIGLGLAAETLSLWTLLQSGELNGESRISTRNVHRLVDNAPDSAEALRHYVSLHHATLGGHVCGHIDTMGEGLEDKVALAGIGGMESEPLDVKSSGALMALPPSACAFQAYKVATLLSSPGPSPDDGDVEISGATHPSSFHAHPDPGMPGPWYRAAFVRSLMRSFWRGGALCDHPRVGSGAWQQNLQRRHNLTLPEVLAIQTLPNRNRIQTFLNMTVAQRQAFVANYLAGLALGAAAAAAAAPGGVAGAVAANGAAAAGGAAAAAAAPGGVGAAVAADGAADGAAATAAADGAAADGAAAAAAADGAADDGAAAGVAAPPAQAAADVAAPPAQALQALAAAGYDVQAFVAAARRASAAREAAVAAREAANRAASRAAQAVPLYLNVTVPQGLTAGMSFNVNLPDGGYLPVRVPEGLSGGMLLQIRLGAAPGAGASGAGASGAGPSGAGTLVRWYAGPSGAGPSGAGSSGAGPSGVSRPSTPEADIWDNYDWNNYDDD